MVGESATKARGVLDLSYPVNEGLVKDFDDLGHVWNYGFDQIGVKPRESKLLLTEAVFNPVKSRQQIAELIFEKYQFSEAQL